MAEHDPTVIGGDAGVYEGTGYDVSDVATLDDGVRNGDLVEEPAARTVVRRVRTSPRLEREAVAEPEPEAALAAPVLPAPLPIAPVPPLRLLRGISGRYRNTGSIQLELRVDVDGQRPLRRVSGDFYIQSGSTLHYHGSFVVHAPQISVTSSTVVLDGLGSFTWNAAFPRVRVAIPRTTIFNPAAPATVRFLTVGGAAGAVYTCPHASPYFRTIQLEEDRVASVTPFSSYNTGSLPAPPPARDLTVVRAFAEAGIEIQQAGARNIVSTAGIGSSWSNAELHNAMVANFSLWRDDPQWKVWMLTAYLHDLGPGLLGIMFDQHGRQRQGCAVFHASLGGSSPSKQRDQLYTCVHELGHCFNLFHSFHKTYMNPPQPNRPAALSWMNYPGRYPGGSAAFWSAFPFQFDEQELVHLRHAFRSHVIMGGDPFGSGAALEDPHAFDEAVQDDSGLRLELRGRNSFAFGEPVVIELKLERTDLRGRRVMPHLHPNFGFVEIAIRRPNGNVVVYKPMMQHCIAPAVTFLDDEQPAIYESAFIGYGDDGLYFDAPGMYSLRAVYLAADGSRIASNTFRVRVRSPLTPEDDDVAELLLGDEQGALFYLLGSDSRFLEDGRDALETVAEDHASHPLAVYAHLVRGVNAGREFKEITRDQTVRVREPDYEESIAELTEVVDASLDGRGVDNITLNLTMRTLADAQEATDGPPAAAATARRMLEHFRSQELRPHVLARIEEQVATFQPGDSYLPPPKRKALINHLDAPVE